MSDMGDSSGADGARNEQVVRILNILKELRREGGADLYELAERFGASVRTIRRDLDALDEAGVALVQRQRPDSQRRRWMLDPERGKAFSDPFGPPLGGIAAADGPSQTYRLRFEAQVAARVLSREWHPTQVAHTQPDGSVLLHFTSSSAAAVTAWVASWQRQVTVLEPATLRAELREFAAWVARSYPR
jgi:predicted DNA-binding transcriptional regulator YafY